MTAEAASKKATQAQKGVEKLDLISPKKQLVLNFSMDAVQEADMAIAKYSSVKYHSNFAQFEVALHAWNLEPHTTFNDSDPMSPFFDALPLLLVWV